MNPLGLVTIALHGAVSKENLRRMLQQARSQKVVLVTVHAPRVSARMQHRTSAIARRAGSAAYARSRHP